MRWLLAIVLPPVAVLSCGKIGGAFLNLFLCLCFFVPGVIHALCVVASHNADMRTEKLISAIKGR
jgi:uncharacterized membrane protein YqaE (UPF0057 family)